jgi:hypothetical protein
MTTTTHEVEIPTIDQRTGTKETVIQRSVIPKVEGPGLQQEIQSQDYRTTKGESVEVRHNPAGNHEWFEVTRNNETIVLVRQN